MQNFLQNVYLIGLNDVFEGKKLTLSSNKVLIGRDNERCQIILPQNFISRLQAQFEMNNGGAVVLTNLSSQQTTLVNGVPISSIKLNDNDRLDFGAGQFVSFTFKQSNNPFETRQDFNSFAGMPVSAPFNHEATIFASPIPSKSATSIFKFQAVAQLKIGRALENDIVLNAPSVSRSHAILTYGTGAQPEISDLGSSNGILVNGELLQGSRLLAPTDLVSIGSFVLSVCGREIKKQDLGASRLTAFEVAKSFGTKTVLQNISLSFYPREFIGLMGPSGCGKSTLMNALNGMNPATNGQVFINELDLYKNFDALRQSIGYVPQRDILHDALSVERTLYYAAKMRLPQGTSPEQVAGVVTEVIQTVGLEEHRTNAFRQLSGGQQKRLSLGIELITKPTFLFLDEPTSPLDPETTENMMILFRRLADEGRIVVMVTHKFEKFDSMHQVVMLTKGGHLAFFGPPPEALNYFKCREPAQIYHRMAESTPLELNKNFLQSETFQKFVNRRLIDTSEIIQNGKGEFSIPQTGAERKFGFGQWLTLTRRYLEIKLKDQRNTLLLLLQAPIIAFILSIITENKPNEGTTLFISAIIAIWFGANNAIREIVCETAIYERERLVNLKIPSYIFSKFAVLSGIGLLQCLLFIGILTFLGRFESSDFVFVTLILYLTLLAGISIGLFFSALVNSTEKAMSILPLILIPQLLLSGFLKPLDDIYVNLKAEKPATVANYDKYQAEKDKKIEIDPKNPTVQPKVPEPIEKRDGLGIAKYAANLMVARWTMEGLAHEVSLQDEKARDLLASRMTMVEYEQVLNGESEDKIKNAYRQRMIIDLFVLSGFNIFFLLLTIWMLKRKDVL